MKEKGFNQEMNRIKNKIEALKKGFKMKPKIQILINRKVVYSNSNGTSNELYYYQPFYKIYASIV